MFVKWNQSKADRTKERMCTTESLKEIKIQRKQEYAYNEIKKETRNGEWRHMHNMQIKKQIKGYQRMNGRKNIREMESKKEWNIERKEKEYA